MQNNPKTTILNMNFDAVTLDQLMSQILLYTDKQEKCFIVTANPEIVVHAIENSCYKHSIHKANYVVADGIGIVMASKLLNDPLPERVAGFDTMMKLLCVANENKQSVYFYGAKPDVMEKFKNTIQVEYPNISIVGYSHGYMKDTSTIVEEIKNAQPDYVFVALGMPKQEEWIANNIDNFNKGVFIGVGGSFDVLAGEVKRAPDIWIKYHLEWLYRVIQEPIRFKRLFKLVKFSFLVCKEKLSNIFK
jgi:N-acetylglucosaminyldiphosphoundecaprenol N-acetyl-beta-D-mannosaminyltransferase